MTSTQTDFAALLSSYLVVVIGLAAALAVIMLVILIRFRSGRGGPVSTRADNRLIEAGAVAVFAGIAVFLLVRTFTVESREDRLVAAPFLRVDVAEYQWGFAFSYPSLGVTVVGEPTSLPTLVLPAGRPVEISLTARDVVHSFWVPALRFQRAALPGLVERFDLVVPQGVYAGGCAFFCGLHHAEMQFSVRGVSDADWAAFVAARRVA